MVLSKKDDEVYLYGFAKPKKLYNIYIFNKKSEEVTDNYINKITNIEFEDFEISCFNFTKLRFNDTTGRDIFCIAHREDGVIVGRDIYFEESQRYILDDLINSSTEINKEEKVKENILSEQEDKINNETEKDLDILEKTKILNKIDSLLNTSNANLFLNLLNTLEKETINY